MQSLKASLERLKLLSSIPEPRPTLMKEMQQNLALNNIKFMMSDSKSNITTKKETERQKCYQKPRETILDMTGWN